MSEPLTNRAIILRRVPYGDADWIVTFFSREVGRMSGIARAARKSLRRFGSGLEPGAVTRLTYRVRGQSDLVTIEESHVFVSLTGLMTSLERLEAAGGAIRLALAFLKDHHASPEKFDLMEEYLARLTVTDPTPAMRLAFTLKWLSLAGFEPLLECCVACGVITQGGSAFSPSQGGVLCSACAPLHGAAHPLPASARDAMRALTTQSVHAAISADDERLISSLLGDYMTYILERPHACG